MTEQQFLSMMKEEILDTDIDVTMDMSLSDIEEWDSLAFVSFIAMAKASASKKIDRTTVQNATTVKELYTLLQ